MNDWLKKRLSPTKKDSSRWKELAEAIQEFSAENFDPDYNVLAGLRSIYTADEVNQKRIIAEMGHYFEDGITDENIPASVSARKMELHQKETNVPLVRSMARIGFASEWMPLYAPRGDVYGTAFYTEDELAAAGLDINAAVTLLDSSWAVGSIPATKLSSAGVYMTSRAKMALNLGGTAPDGVDIARRRIMQVKPLHIVFDGFKYRVWLEISAVPTHEMRLTMAKVVDQHYPWCTPKLTGLWKIGTNLVIPARALDGTWTLNGDAVIGEYLVSGIVHETLKQCTILSSAAMRKQIERPAAYMTARLSESHLRVNGNWNVGPNKVLTLTGAGMTKMIGLIAEPAIATTVVEGWSIQYPISPIKLGKMPGLTLYRRVNGEWGVGRQLGVAGRTLDGGWKVRAPGLKADGRLAATKQAGNVGVFRKVGRYDVQVGEGWNYRLNGNWKIGAYHDLDGTWSLDGTCRLGAAVRLGKFFRHLDGSWAIGHATKRLDGAWRVGQGGPECDVSVVVHKIAA